MGLVYAAVLTPRRNQEASVDLGAALDLIEFAGRSGVDGIALLGSTGEFLHFGAEDRRRLTQFALKRSRVPVLVNVSHSCLDGALDLARAAAGEGAAGLLLMPPYFFRYGQAEIREFYRRFAREMEDAAPIFLYNVPEHSTELESQTALELLSGGLFAGIKDSSGRPDYLRRLMPLREAAHVRLLVGNDRLFTRARTEGADGVISGVASAVPELLLGLEAAIRDRDAGKRDLLDGLLQELLAWIDKFPTPVGVREAAAARGLPVGAHAVPPGEQMRREIAAFQDWFPGWLHEVRKAAGQT